jgi:TRAP-type C4-dicarboxylate transport system permease small subunit
MNMPNPVMEHIDIFERSCKSSTEAALIWAERLSRAAVWCAGALTLASVALITLDVLLRKFAGRGVGGADELAGYAFAISTAWAFAFAVLHRAHVRVDVLYHRLPVRAAAFIDWISLVAFAVLFILIARYGFEVVQLSFEQSSRANSTLGTPLWIPQALWWLGIAWMCVVIGLLLVRASQALIKGDVKTVQRWAGVRSTQQEALAEAESGERLIKGEMA